MKTDGMKKNQIIKWQIELLKIIYLNILIRSRHWGIDFKICDLAIHYK